MVNEFCPLESFLIKDFLSILGSRWIPEWPVGDGILGRRLDISFCSFMSAYNATDCS